MAKHTRDLALLAILVLFSFMMAAGDTAADVTGTWTIQVTGDAGSASQTIILTQNGNKISGTFKGPRQSGKLEGAVAGNAIKFHVKTRVPLDYTGTVDGDSMRGTMSGRGKNGNWTAKRAK